MQLEFYKLLLNYSPTYRKYKVTRAHILFVKPEQKDGQVFDKIYEFDEEFEKDILSLMKVVYKIVSTLEFIDDPEVFIPPDQSKGLKQIKEFIALLLAKITKNSRISLLLEARTFRKEVRGVKKYLMIRPVHQRIHCVTWTCQRCGAVFLTQTQWALHVLTCGS